MRQRKRGERLRRSHMRAAAPPKYRSAAAPPRYCNINIAIRTRERLSKYNRKRRQRRGLWGQGKLRLAASVARPWKRSSLACRNS
eukprot:482118-Prymnesium_polylepis.1